LMEIVSMDMLQMMHVVIVATIVHGVGPPRWFWETNLLCGMRAYGAITRHVREVAMLVCLILSAATPDEVCIAATISLFAAGLLDLHRLKDADEAEIKKHIGKAGISNNRSSYLKKLAGAIINDYNGSVPADVNDLMTFDGVGRKSAVLAMNEIFGLTVGIGVDTHVTEVSRALGFVVPPVEIGLTMEHVETSLTQLVPFDHWRIYNPIVGSFAQLFVRLLANLVNKEANHRAGLVVVAMADHLHKPYHVELLWYAIARVRSHYRRNKKESS
jgi:endonuclease III